MEKRDNSSGSALSAIARHEGDLLSKESEAEHQAHEIIDTARLNAQRHIDSSNATLNVDIAEMRSKAEAARERIRIEHAQESQRKREALRQEAQRKAGHAVHEIVKLVLPAGYTGSSR